MDHQQQIFRHLDGTDLDRSTGFVVSQCRRLPVSSSPRNITSSG
jgi:hypothetical protein